MGEDPTYEEVVDLCDGMVNELERMQALATEVRCFLDLLGIEDNAGDPIVSLKCNDANVTNLIIQQMWTIQTILSGDECPPMPNAIEGTIH